MSFWLTRRRHGRRHVRLALRRARAAHRPAGLLGPLPPLRPDRRLRLARHAVARGRQGRDGDPRRRRRSSRRSPPGGRGSCGSRSRSGWPCSGCCGSRSERLAERSARAAQPPGEPAAPLAADRGELGRAEHPAEPVGERSQQAAGEEDPRLGVGIAIGRHRAGRLVPAHHVGHEVVHLAHVGADVALDLLVLGRLGDALDPEVRQQRIRPRRALLGVDIGERARAGDRAALRSIAARSSRQASSRHANHSSFFEGK